MKELLYWAAAHWVEIFGAVTGIIYVFLEIRQNIWLWPVGIVTSAVYIWVFFHDKLYADTCLQVYYLVISIIGWYWWVKGGGLPSEAIAKEGQLAKVEVEKKEELKVTRIKLKLAFLLTVIWAALYSAMYFVLSRLTDSPVPGFDAFLTSLSVVATWMLARKIYEHWFLWIIVNATAFGLFIFRGLYPTAILYAVYCIMSFGGLHEWRKSFISDQEHVQ